MQFYISKKNIWNGDDILKFISNKCGWPFVEKNGYCIFQVPEAEEDFFEFVFGEFL